MKHSMMNRRLMLEWITDCHDAGTPMPSDAAIMDRFGWDREELARTLLADLADAKSIVITGAGRDRVITLRSEAGRVAQSIGERLPPTVKRGDPQVDRVAALITNIARGTPAAVQKEAPMANKTTPTSGPDPVLQLLREANGSIDTMVANLLARAEAAETRRSVQRPQDAETIATLTARAEAAEGKLASLKALFA